MVKTNNLNSNDRFVPFPIGCVGTIKYTEPTTGDTARIRFTTNTPDVIAVFVRSFETEDCKGEEEVTRLKNGTLLIGSPKTLGMPLWNYHKNAAKEFIFSTERPLTIMFGGFVGKQISIGRLKQIHCGVPVIYRLDEGKDYEVIYEMDPEKYRSVVFGNDGVSHYEMDKLDCTASIFKIVEFEGGNHEKKFLKTFSNIGVDSQIIGLFGASEKEMLDDETSTEGCIEAFHKGSWY